jgi:hypothetical protein
VSLPAGKNNGFFRQPYCRQFTRYKFLYLVGKKKEKTHTMSQIPFKKNELKLLQVTINDVLAVSDQLPGGSG